jgi:dTDP-4-amino-4,6-dideoxygalactose transaminase
MKVPLLDLKAQLSYLEDDLLEAVTRVVKSTRYIQGPEVENLEREIAAYSGAAHGIGVTSGTDALLVCLMALGIGRGDRVLTTPFSFFATMGVVLRVGALPVFADIDPLSFNLDMDMVEQLLQEDSSRSIKAIIPVHLYGQCADMSRLMELSKQYQVPIIEDAAQAIGAEYPCIDGAEICYRRAGSMGLAGCFSFFPSKNLGGIGDGGMVITQDQAFAEKIALLRNHGAFPKYYHQLVGGNFRLDPIQAAALRIKLPYLDQWHRQRRRNAERYNTLLNRTDLLDSGKVKIPLKVYREDCGEQGQASLTHIFNQYVLRVQRRNDLVRWLSDNEIGCEIYYPVPLHKQECLSGVTLPSHCPQAELAAEETLALPIYPELTEEMQVYVIEKIVQFYR